MAEICNKVFPSNLFTVVPENRNLVTEMSTLMGNSSDGDPFTQVYDDSCDEGFNIVSRKTGVAATFVVDGWIQSDGEDVAVRLVPTKQTIRNTPSLKGWTVTVFND